MNETTSKKKKGLGRGLEVLLGKTPDISMEEPASTLLLSQLRAGKYQPRTRLDEVALSKLVQSVKEHGVIQPILVRLADDSGTEKIYEIIAGERRFRAAQQAGLSEIPVVIRNVDDKMAAAAALIENMQRENLNPLEEARGIHRLITEFDFTHERAGETVGRSRSAVTNLLRLLNLTRPVQTMLVAGDIDMGHARALLAVEGAVQIALANEIVARRLSVREAERLVANELKKNRETKRKQTEKSEDTILLEKELSEILAAKVSFKMRSKGRGQMIIDFSSLDVLDGVLEKIRPKSE